MRGHRYEYEGVVEHVWKPFSYKDLKAESESKLFNIGCLRMDHECSN